MHTSSLPLTEQRNPATMNIDKLPSRDICRLINREDAQTAVAVAEALPRIAEAVDLLHAALADGQRVFYMGAGTSGRLGVLDASELLPTFNLEPGRVVAIIAGGDDALRHSIETAEDDPAQGRADLEANGFSSGDILVGIAASGHTPYVIGGMEYARSLNAGRIAVVCSPGSPMADLATVAIETAPGPEVITGSTRMKAGTVQKMILNMLSTATMIRLGKVYSNLMVDVQPTNEKLRRRAVRIVSEAAAVDEAEASKLLEAAGGEVKTAVLMGILNCTADVARRKLNASQGVIRDATQA